MNIYPKIHCLWNQFGRSPHVLADQLRIHQSHKFAMTEVFNRPGHARCGKVVRNAGP